MQRNSLSLHLSLSLSVFCSLYPCIDRVAPPCKYYDSWRRWPIGEEAKSPRRSAHSTLRSAREIETYSLGSLYYITFYPRIHIYTEDTSPLESAADRREI